MRHLSIADTQTLMFLATCFFLLRWLGSDHYNMHFPHSYGEVSSHSGSKQSQRINLCQRIVLPNSIFKNVNFLFYEPQTQLWIF